MIHLSKLQIIREKVQWEETIRKFNHLDIYYSYPFGNLFAKQEEGELLAVYMEIGESRLFYPFIKREVPYDAGPIFDIVTPYGYGGPYIEGNSSIITHFYECFTEFCMENNIITETIRCHPLIQNERYLKMSLDIQYIRKTAVVDLSQPLTHIRKSYSTMNKRNIKKAMDMGLSSFIAEPTESNIQKFIDLYYETMDRNQATKYYYFPKEYFFEQMKATQISNTYLLFAIFEGEIIAGVMVLIGKDFAHYHLGASKTEYLHLRPNNLLFDYMISFCKQKGSSLLHLGGGYEEDDGLFKFKSSFTNNNHFKYFIGKKVHNQFLYDQIIYEISASYEVNEKFFPIYRATLGPKKTSIKIK